MGNELHNISWKNELYQSEKFGNAYREFLDVDSSVLQSSFEFSELKDIYQSILNEFSSTLSEFQVNVIGDIFLQFDKITELIDPERLKFEFSFNDDEEFLLYRKSDLGLTNVIIHDDECVAYSFIPFDKNKENQLEFFYTPIDFQKLALILFAK